MVVYVKGNITIQNDNPMTHTDFNHLLSRIKALSPAQMRQLRQQLDSELAHPSPRAGIQPQKPPVRSHAKGAKRTKATSQQATKPMTRDEFHRYLIEIGLMSQLPDTAADYDDPDDEPVPIKGEPLSETVIRERR
jgi:hypothetical protein